MLNSQLIRISSVLLITLSCISARAKVFHVTNPADTTNVASLRGAIIAANALGGNNTILLFNSVYYLTITGADEKASYTGDLNITNGSVSIRGFDNHAVTITASNLGDRILQVSPNTQVGLINVTLTGGTAPSHGHPASEPGGAIYNLGFLGLQNCVIMNNSSGTGYNYGPSGSESGDGGGIYNAGKLIILDSFITANIVGSHEFPAEGGNGGGIFNSGICSINNCRINNNAAGFATEDFGFPGWPGDGGGIYNTGDMTVTGSTLRGNLTGAGVNGGLLGGGPPEPLSGSDGGSGGGIYSIGTLKLNNCTIIENSTGFGGDGATGFYSGGAGGAGGSGGGIYNGGDLIVTECTLAKNSCGKGGQAGSGFEFILSGIGGNGGNGGTGAGIFNGGSLTVLASTLSANIGGDGDRAGDGQALSRQGGFLDTNGIIQTITNYLAAGPGGIGGTGGTGGIFTASNATTMLRDVLIASNFPTLGGSGGATQTTNGTFVPAASGGNGPPDIGGNFLSSGHNLVGITDGSSGFINGVKHDLVGSSANPINPLLGPLANNGGSTLTMSPLPGSPAIDGGDDAILNAPYKLTTDQRGQPRRHGAHVDIGAVEYNGKVNGIVQPPMLTGQQATESGFQFTFTGAAQNSYSVLVTTNFVDWSLLGPATEILPGQFSFQDPVTNSPRRFYKIRSP